MSDIAAVTCAICGALTAGVIAQSCERGDCPVERKPPKSIHPFPRFGRDTADAEIHETAANLQPEGEHP